ncbi:MAG TPA: ATP-binding protein [Pseudolysinimonas sp.]|nr:ATP-binding protein [Pseudolysinimonas sp.]
MKMLRTRAVQLMNRNDSVGVTAIDSIFRVGRVQAVRGRQIEIKVDKTKNGSHLLYRDEVLRNVSVGGYLKIAKGFTEIIVKVDEESVHEDRFVSDYQPKAGRLNRVLVVSLIGYFTLKGEFERGVKELPLIDNECFLLTRDEFNRVHNFVADDDEALDIGTLALEKGQPIAFGLNSLMASHFGIFGNTGSGKSYTLARIYQAIFDKYKDRAGFKSNARFLLIDFNGEYVDAGPTGKSSSIIVGPSFKKTYVIDTSRDDADKIPVADAVINEATFWSVALQATEITQRPFLARAIEHAYWTNKTVDADTLKQEIKRIVLAVTKDYDPTLERTMVQNFVHDLELVFKDLGTTGLEALANDYHRNLQFHGSGNQHYYYTLPNGDRIYSDNAAFERDVVNAKVDALTIDMSILSIIDLIRLKITMQFHDDVLKKYANREHIAPLMKRLEQRVRDLKRTVTLGTDLFEGKNLAVISLKDASINMKKIVPLLVSKQLYDAKKREHDDKKYLNIIIDEAHNILSLDSARESEQWREYRLETFEEIIKEGRKFGVFLTIASQRPHDISPTVISQLHNYFLHRLINELDINAIRYTVSYLDRVSFEALSILPTGTAIFAGLTAHVPVVVSISPMDEKYAPNSRTMTPIKNW